MVASALQFIVVPSVHLEAISSAHPTLNSAELEPRPVVRKWLWAAHMRQEDAMTQLSGGRKGHAGQSWCPPCLLEGN